MDEEEKKSDDLFKRFEPLKVPFPGLIPLSYSTPEEYVRYFKKFLNYDLYMNESQKSKEMHHSFETLVLGQTLNAG